LGRSYLIDHCVRYHKQKVDELNFRVNLTEINRGVLGILTGQWDDIPRYYDSLVPPKKEKELTEQEVVENIRNKLRQAGE
jgi:hypothetical protein